MIWTLLVLDTFCPLLKTLKLQALATSSLCYMCTAVSPALAPAARRYSKTIIMCTEEWDVPSTCWRGTVVVNAFFVSDQSKVSRGVHPTGANQEENDDIDD
ncbi:hypothetical protein B0H13DRAFT_2312872 [Mycena leptocephala]|nr:hypothetical protein B0H13DRAFT_2312872 [Mycena leptocephala]